VGLNPDFDLLPLDFLDDDFDGTLNEKCPRRRRQRPVYDASVLGVGQAEKLTPSPFFLPIFPSIAK